MSKSIEIKKEILSQIYLIRGRKVMLDSDLARIYGVNTSRLNQQVARNKERFPSEFMFELAMKEYRNLMLQIATSSSETLAKFNDSTFPVISKWGGRRKLPYVFTEHGAIMLASVLNSKVAIKASIYVVKAFVKLRDLLSMQHELQQRIDDLEKRTFDKFDKHAEQLKLVFQALRELVNNKERPREPVGFKIGKKQS